MHAWELPPPLRWQVGAKTKFTGFATSRELEAVSILLLGHADERGIQSLVT